MSIKEIAKRADPNDRDVRTMLRVLRRTLRGLEEMCVCPDGREVSCEACFLLKGAEVDFAKNEKENAAFLSE